MRLGPGTGRRHDVSLDARSPQTARLDQDEILLQSATSGMPGAALLSGAMLDDALLAWAKAAWTPKLPAVPASPPPVPDNDKPARRPHRNRR